MKHNPAVRCLIVVLVLISVSSGHVLAAEHGADDLLRAGIASYRDARFEVAADSFLEVIQTEAHQQRHPEGYFWLAKTYMALGSLDSAARNLEFYIYTYPQHPLQAEAHYQRGRLFYLQSEYEQAVQAFADFIEDYPESAFDANAIYWSGEALFSLGRFSEAREMFNTVVTEYPTSYRMEAARYRLSILDLQNREETLLDLLRISHQELLYTIQDHQRREQEFRETIQEYRQRMQNAAPADLRAELESREARNEALQQENTRLRRRIDELQDAQPQGEQ